MSENIIITKGTFNFQDRNLLSLWVGAALGPPEFDCKYDPQRSTPAAGAAII